MTALKLFTTIMKITLLPSFFKAGALTALACGTLALTSISLSSCGGGGSATDTPDTAAASVFKGRIYQLTSSPTPSIKLSFGEQPNRNSPVLRGTSTWGTKTYTTWYMFSDSTVTDGRCTTTVRFSNMDEQVLREPAFVAFMGYAQATSVTPAELCFKVDVNTNTNTGTFKLQETTATVIDDNGTLADATVAEKTLSAIQL